MSGPDAPLDRDAAPDAVPGRVAVVGLGLIGGSLTRLLAARGVDVVGTDLAAGTREAARRTRLAVADDVADCVARADLVVLAVPLRAMAATAQEVARHAPSGATVTDVGSVKGPVRAALAGAGLDGRYVGAHPMAGTEHSGFEASSADLLDGVTWAVTLDGTDGTDGTDGSDGTDDGATVATDRLAAVLGLVTGPCAGRAVVLTDEVHDEATALVSHVPHVLATQLLNAVAGAPVREVAWQLAAGSFRDGTRVAFTDPARTEAMVTENAAWVAPALRKVVRDLELLVGALESNGSVRDFFHGADPVRAAGRPGVGRGGSQHGGAPPEAVEEVALADGPAELLDRCRSGAVVVGLDTDRGVALLT